MNIHPFVGIMIIVLATWCAWLTTRVGQLERTAKSAYGCSTGIAVVTSLDPVTYTSICR